MTAQLLAVPCSLFLWRYLEQAITSPGWGKPHPPFRLNSPILWSQICVNPLLDHGFSGVFSPHIRGDYRWLQCVYGILRQLLLRCLSQWVTPARTNHYHKQFASTAYWILLASIAHGGKEQGNKGFFWVIGSEPFQKHTLIFIGGYESKPWDPNCT